MALPQERYSQFYMLSDFTRFKCDVAIRCPKCGHTTTMTTDALKEVFGPIQTKDAAKRLVCTECGMKGAELAPAPAG